MRVTALGLTAALSMCEFGGDSTSVPRPAPTLVLAPSIHSLVPPAGEVPIPAERRTALAYQFEAPIFKRPDGEDIIGVTRRGGRVEVARWVRGESCDHGWYNLATGGYVCAAFGFNTAAGRPELPPEIATRLPASDEPLPFEYAKVIAEDRPIYWRLPTPEEEAQAQAPGRKGAPVKTRSRGVLLVALDSVVERPEDRERFVRTIRGHFLRESDVQRKRPTTMVGEWITEDAPLPLAFVIDIAAPVVDEEGTSVGTAFKYARFPVLEETVRGEEAYVRTAHGFIPRKAVRIARELALPSRVPAGSQWVHVDLEEQVLVAYEGETPKRATLVSSGKAGYEPPLGVFQIGKKYITKTMSGEDDVDGSYEVEEVPWIMYYWGSLALHGAYWHDGFGMPRSHGCTNLPPVDAQWLFRWAKPELPKGWHGAVGLHGPWLVVTRGAQLPGSLG